MPTFGGNERFPGMFWDNGGAAIHVMHPDYGAKCDGVTDDTTKVQLAADAASAIGAKLIFPPGATTLITDTIRIRNHGVVLVGDPRTSRIRFNPTTAKGCFEFKLDDTIYGSTPSTINSCGTHGLTFESTNTVQKLFAVRWVDVSQFHMERTSVHYSWQSTGSKSIGFESMGREHVTAHLCFSYADQPLIFSQNPRDGGTGIDADFITWDGGELAPTIKVATAGVGTVSCAAGIATFSTSQAGVVAAGGVLVVGGVTYAVLTFNGTTGATIKQQNTPFSTTPTFAAGAFTTTLPSTDYAITLNPNLRSVQQLTFRKVVFPSGMGALSWVGAGATRDCDGILFDGCRGEQSQNVLGYFTNIERDGWNVAGVQIRSTRPSFSQNGVRLRRCTEPFLQSYTFITTDPTLNALDFDATVSKPSWHNITVPLGCGFSLAGLTQVWASGRNGSVDYALPPSASYDNVASTSFDVTRMSQLEIDGPISQNIAPTAQFGIYTNRTIAAVGAVAEWIRCLAALSASANGDTLSAINLSPSFAANSKTGLTYRGLRIASISGGAVNYAIITGLGEVNFGDNCKLGAVGSGFYVKEGANATMGVATLVAGSVVVSTTKVTASSRIQLTGQADGGTPGWVRVSARVVGTSFTITSSSGADTSSVAWQIVEPA